MKNNNFDLLIVGCGIVGSYTAYSALKKGLSVGVVDCGSNNLKKIICTEPSLLCMNRYHKGAFEARNHIVGGNSTFWGGGLIRPPSTNVLECLGHDKKNIQENGKGYCLNYEFVDEILKLQTDANRKNDQNFSIQGTAIVNSIIHTLDGRNRDLTSKWIKFCENQPNFKIFSSTKIIGFHSDSKIQNTKKCNSIILSNKNGKFKIKSKRFLICAGTIDCNYLVHKHWNDLSCFKKPSKIGSRLHDHLSVKIAEIQVPKKSKFNDLIGPKFSKKVSIRKHYEFVNNKDNPNAFFHFTHNFDEVRPYNYIKLLLDMRQEKHSLLKIFNTCKKVIYEYKDITKLIFHKLINKKLYLSEGLKASLTLDFESFPHTKNNFIFDKDLIRLNWDLNKEDEDAFIFYIEKIQKILEKIKNNYSIKITPKFNLESRSEALDYFRKNVIDSYHLGGGLSDFVTITDNYDSMRLKGSENVHIISNAILSNAGYVNPTYLLLSISQKFIDKIKK